MEIQEVQKKEIKNIVMSIRTSSEISKWMKENDIHPSKVFDTAIKELMQKN